MCVCDTNQKDGLAKIVEKNPDLKWWFDEIEKTVLKMTDTVSLEKKNLISKFRGNLILFFQKIIYRSQTVL